MMWLLSGQDHLATVVGVAASRFTACEYLRSASCSEPGERAVGRRS